MPIESTPQAPRKLEPKRILLQGGPGSGKSSFAIQFPRPWIIDVDENLDGAEEYVRQRMIRTGTDSLSFLYDNPRKKNGQVLNTNQCWDNLMDLTLGMKGSTFYTKFDWCIIDSLQLVNEFNIQDVMRKKSLSELETRHWDNVKSNYFRLLAGALRDLGKGIIVTVHDKKLYKASSDKKDMMGKVVCGYEPNVQSGIRDAFGGLFTDVWACETRAEPGNKLSRVIRTAGDPFRDLKNSMGMPKEIVIPENGNGWEALAPFHDKLMAWTK